MLVMRKGIGLLAITAAATLLAPGSAAAKGSTLRSEEEGYAPGNRAVAHALVETSPRGHRARWMLPKPRVGTHI